MSNKVTVPFGFTFLNDGTSTAVTISLATQPSFIVQSGSVQPLTANILSVLSGVTQLVCDSGATVTSSSLLLGILTVNLSAPGTAGTTNIIGGYLLF
jgi:hypothetical protein